MPSSTPSKHEDAPKGLRAFMTGNTRVQLYGRREVYEVQIHAVLEETPLHSNRKLISLTAALGGVHLRQPREVDCLALL